MEDGPFKNKLVFSLMTEEEKKLPYYVKSVGSWQTQDYILRESGFTDFHWFQCSEGQGLLQLEGKEYLISENMGFFFHPGISHEYYPTIKPWKTQWVTFDGFGVLPLLEIVGLEKWGVYYLSNLERLKKHVDDIYALACSDNHVTRLECSAILYQLLIELKHNIHSSQLHLKSSRHKILQPVLTYIHHHFNSTLTIGNMASLINSSPQHLCRLFKQVLNIRPFEYVTGVRLQKAKELLLHADNLTIKQIANLVGYNDSGYFCTTFKEYEGVTPLTFKKMYISSK